MQLFQFVIKASYGNDSVALIQWATANRDKVQDYGKRYRALNRAKIKAYSARYRALRKSISK